MAQTHDCWLRVRLSQRHILKHKRRPFCLQFTSCVPLLQQGKVSFFFCIETIYPQHNECTQKKEHVVTPHHLQRWLSFTLCNVCSWRVVQWDHCSEALFCLTVCSQPADHFEHRMFVVIGHNSFQKEIRAFTFDIISKWFTDLMCQRIVLLLSFGCYFSVINWCWSNLRYKSLRGDCWSNFLSFFSFFFF